MSRMVYVKSRYWTCIVYTEDVPDIVERLSSLCVRALLSPVHHSINVDDCTERKEHRHLIVFFDGPVPVQTLINSVGLQLGISPHLWQRVNDIVSYARYLIHLDQPDKEQFPDGYKSVLSFGGVDYVGLIERSADVCQIVADMQDWVKANHCYYFNELMDYAKACEPLWYRALIKSQRENMWRYIVSMYNHDLNNPPKL